MSTIRQRGGIVSAVTKVETYVNSIASGDPNDSVIIRSASNLKAQMRLVQSMKEKFIPLQVEIIGQQNAPERISQEQAALSEFITRCDNLCHKIEEILAADPEANRDETTSGLLEFFRGLLSDSEASHRAQLKEMVTELNKHAAKNTRSSNLKLPQVNLPSFDGKYSDWIPFKDSFNSMILNYPDLSKSRMLDYLKSSVSGDAASCIKNIPVTDDNFDVAWKLLTDRFERKNEIVADHIKSFFQMPKVTPSSPNAILQISNLYSETLMALDAMNVTSRDPWAIQYTLEHLDAESKVLWGRECKGEVATEEQFHKFLNQRCIDYQNSDQASTPAKPSQNNPSNQKKSLFKPATNQTTAHVFATSAVPNNCKCCNESAHPMYRCPSFLNKSAEERFQVVKKLSLCRNCLANHLTKDCTFHKCNVCQGRHSRFLHDYFVTETRTAIASPSPPAAPTAAQSASTDPPASSTAQAAAQNLLTSITTSPSSSSGVPNGSILAVSSLPETQPVESPPKVFLATAMVKILTANGDPVPCRLVMDGAAQVNVMTSELFSRLNLPKIPTKFSISGINDRRTKAKFLVKATIFSRTSDATFNFNCFVLPRIAGNIPNWKVDTSALKIPPNIQFADPSWAIQKPVDLLLCGNPYWASWLSGTVELGPGLPFLKETVFGHVVVGEHEPLPAPEDPDGTDLTLTALLETTHGSFGDAEIPPESSVAEEQAAAERHFADTFMKHPQSGRFIVRLPFKKDPLTTLGDSRSLAIRQQLSLERRFERNPELRKLYTQVMEEWITNEWVECIRSGPRPPIAYYMPHHGVMKDSTTTKLRIVYNASAKTSSGYSLNDILCVGPTVQPTLADTLVRFRRHKFAFTADISKMYLQMLMTEEDCDFQRFFWRSNPSQPLLEYRVVRVCFGIASSPFLATRALIQIAMECETTHSLASEALKFCFYVDDCLVSTDCPEKARQILSQLIEVLQRSGFPLEKVSKNFDNPEGEVNIGGSYISALGLKWNPQTDNFTFASSISITDECKTKRNMSSLSAKIFDPLGLVGPVVVETKLMMQEAHVSTDDWNKTLPPELIEKWNEFVLNLQHLNQITIPRWISSTPNQLKSSELWWNWPAWIVQDVEMWPPQFKGQRSAENPPDYPEITITVLIQTILTPESTVLSKFLQQYPTLVKLQRAMAYWLRYVRWLSTRGSPIKGLISAEEMTESLNVLIRMDQRESLPGLVEQLQTHESVFNSKWKYLSSLALFVDPNGLILVGGRLERSGQPYDAIHQILLPKSRLTEIILENKHSILHLGPTLLLATVRQRFWPLGGRDTTRKIVHRCRRCIRANPSPRTQQMGQLPSHRVQYFRPFQATGVDYAGPILYKPSTPRSLDFRLKILTSSHRKIPRVSRGRMYGAR